MSNGVNRLSQGRQGLQAPGILDHLQELSKLPNAIETVQAVGRQHLEHPPAPGNQPPTEVIQRLRVQGTTLPRRLKLVECRTELLR